MCVCGGGGGGRGEGVEGGGEVGGGGGGTTHKHVVTTRMISALRWACSDESHFNALFIHWTPKQHNKNSSNKSR